MLKIATEVQTGLEIADDMDSISTKAIGSQVVNLRIPQVVVDLAEFSAELFDSQI